MARQTVQSKKRNEEEDERDDEEEDEDERDDEEEDEDESKVSEDEDDEEGDEMDSAFAGSGRRASIYIEPWRKRGHVTTWLHKKAKFSRVGRHKWFEIVSFTKRRTQEEVSFVKFSHFNCHELPDYVSISKDRNEDDLRRSHPASKCPFCKMLEWVEDGVISGRISPDAEIFRFDDGDPEHLQVLHAAGISGLIGLENAPEKWKKTCKKSKVLQSDPWNENCALKLSHAFQVVDDADPSEVKWALEPPDLFWALKDAIVAKKKELGDDDGDPQKKPYALLWEFDKDAAAKNYGKGNKVYPQPKKKLTGKIRRLIEGPKRNDQHLVIGPGDCLALRASMENAAVIDMPFDEFFKEAQRAGLMNGSASQQPAKSAPKRADDEEDEPKSDAKPKASQKASSLQTKGNTKQTEPEVVGTCDICGEGIGDEDEECGACGTTFDPENDYHVDGIRCTECGTTVPLKDADEEDGDVKQICPKCGTIHRLSPSVDRFYGELREKAYRGEVKFVWTAESKPKPKAAPSGKGRSGRSKSAESTALDKKLKGDDFKF